MCFRTISVVVVVGVFAGTLDSAAQQRDRIVNDKAELDKVQRQVEQSQKTLDSLKKEELSVQKQMAEQDQKITTNQKVIKRLNNQLGSLRQELTATEELLDQQETLLERTRRRYLGDLRRYYLHTAHDIKAPFWEPPQHEIEKQRQTVYVAAVARFESDNVRRVASEVSEVEEQVGQLTSERERVSTLKKKKEVATVLEESKKEKGEKQLEGLRRKKLAEGDKMLSLRQAAEEIERVIAQLEEARKARQKDQVRPTGPSVFATLKGQLKAPFKGKIVTPYGHMQDPITRLKSFSPGIAVQGRGNTPVTAVSGGYVAFVGNLRGYGNFVIINHDEEYYTTYGNLGKTFVQQGEYVASSAKLAVAGEDGLVKFELRKGREPLDPVQWIRIDSF